MNQFELRYGDKTVPVDLSAAKSVTVLKEKEIAAIEDLNASFLQAVEQDCINSRPLKELVLPGDQVTIVISDITRFWMRQDKICTLLVDYLHNLGIAYHDMAVLVALGTHRPQSVEELKQLAGEETYAKVQVVNHDCMAENLVDVGVTPMGTRVLVNPLAVGRKVILIGGTVHHLMAGFGGGRKSILPGICAKSTINQNHIHSLSPDQPRSNPLIGMGRLEENPIDRDMNDAAALVNPVFGINIVVNSQSRHCRLLCGHWKSAWEESCRVVQQVMGLPIPQKADMVVVSCGGYPKDINLYQAVKSLLNAAQAVKDGGQIVFLAECREGGGAPAFFSWIESLKKGSLDADLRADFSIAGYIFYACCEVIARSQVLMLTQIDPQTAAQMGMQAVCTPGELAAKLDAAGKDVYVMPSGGSVVPFVME